MSRILFLAPTKVVTSVFPDLRDAGIEVGIAENLKGASSSMRKDMPDLILSRAELPDYKVEDLLSVGEEDPNFPPVIVFSDKATPEEAKKLLELGARDYWVEPLTFEKIQAAIPRKASISSVPAVSTLGGTKPEAGKKTEIIGNDESMRKVLGLARQVAKSKATVLISGESGTGKELFSRFLHNHSDRADQSFVAVNCAALPEHLLESELFGHEKGAFTGAIARKLGKFELAHGGTILLDEITEMDHALQAKLLRALQEEEIDRVGGTEIVKIDVRVLATTNRDLKKWVDEGKFRQDLYYRLNVIPLRLPALRERADDVFALAHFFVKMYSDAYKLPKASFSEESIKWLKEYKWPGNVRELQNIMERAVLLSGGKDIKPAHFLLEGEEWPLFQDESSDAVDSVGSDDLAPASAGTVNSQTEFPDGVIPLHEMERIMILKGLGHTSGNRTQAAEILGISVRTLRNKLNEYRLAGFDVE